MRVGLMAGDFGTFEDFALKKWVGQLQMGLE
jgi:hypothetical protein